MPRSIAFKDFVKQAHRNLKESYPSVTVDYVSEQTRKVNDGEKATNVIAMFIEGMMKGVELTDIDAA